MESGLPQNRGAIFETSYGESISSSGDALSLDCAYSCSSPKKCHPCFNFAVFFVLPPWMERSHRTTEQSLKRVFCIISSLLCASQAHAFNKYKGASDYENRCFEAIELFAAMTYVSYMETEKLIPEGEDKMFRKRTKAVDLFEFKEKCNSYLADSYDMLSPLRGIQIKVASRGYAEARERVRKGTPPEVVEHDIETRARDFWNSK